MGQASSTVLRRIKPSGKYFTLKTFWDIRRHRVENGFCVPHMLKHIALETKWNSFTYSQGANTTDPRSTKSCKAYDLSLLISVSLAEQSSSENL